jgi:hypothetical protein
MLLNVCCVQLTMLSHLHLPASNAHQANTSVRIRLVVWHVVLSTFSVLAVGMLIHA